MAAASLSVLGLSIPNDNDDCSQGAAGRTLEMLNNETTITQAAKSGKSILRHLTSSVNLSQNTPPLAPPKKKHIYNNVEAKRLYPDIYTSRSSGDSTREIANILVHTIKECRKDCTT